MQNLCLLQEDITFRFLSFLNDRFHLSVNALQNCFFLGGSMIAWSCLSVLLCCGDLSRVNSIISPMKRVLSWCFQSWILFAFLWCQYWCRSRFTSSGNSTVGNSLSGLQYRPFANRCHQGTPLLRDKNKRHGFLRWTSRGWGRNPRPR